MVIIGFFVWSLAIYSKAPELRNGLFKFFKPYIIILPITTLFVSIALFIVYLFDKKTIKKEKQRDENFKKFFSKTDEILDEITKKLCYEFEIHQAKHDDLKNKLLEQIKKMTRRVEF